MFEATRGGTRGGASEFKWTDVKADKDRENYLGHSINAPQGRWQNHKDIHWYNRNKSDVTDEEALRREKARELKDIKMREENELSIALGYGPVHDLEKLGMEEGDRDPLQVEGSGGKTEREIELEELEAEEKRRRKELKREKKAMKEVEKKIKKQEKEERRLESKSHRSHDHRDRVRDHSRDRKDQSRSRDRSLSPARDSRRHGEGRRSDRDDAYDRSTRHREGGEVHRNGDFRQAPRHDNRPYTRQDDREVEQHRSSQRDKERDMDVQIKRSPEVRSSAPRNNDRKGANYDFEAERARDRQRWERHHDRERGLKEGDGWGKREEGRSRGGGW